MIHYTFIAIDCITCALWSTACISLFPNARRHQNKAGFLCFFYFLLDNISSWHTTYLPIICNTEDFFMTLASPIFLLCFFYHYKDGHPVSNYLIFDVSILLQFPFLMIFTLCRDHFFPQAEVIAFANQGSDWLSLAIFPLAYGCAFIAFRLIYEKLNTLLHKVPQTAINILVLLMLILDIIPTLFSWSNAPIKKAQYLATASIMLLLFSIIIILLFFVFLRKYREETLNKQLFEAEENFISNYYRNIKHIHTQLRHLYHDMNNHLYIAEYPQTNESNNKKYSAEILAQIAEFKKSRDNLSPPATFNVDGFSDYENYLLWDFVKDLLSSSGVMLHDIERSSFADNNGAQKIILYFPLQIKKLDKKYFRCGHKFALIELAAKNHNGSITWKREGNAWTLCIII